MSDARSVSPLQPHCKQFVFSEVVFLFPHRQRNKEYDEGDITTIQEKGRDNKTTNVMACRIEGSGRGVKEKQENAWLNTQVVSRNLL